MKLSKRIVFLITVCLFVSATSCSAANNADEAKLVEILGSMNFPSKNMILANKAQFLQELKAVLDNDSDFLLVLVDKTHFLQPDYVPEDLIPLKKNDLYNINRNDLSLRIPVEKALQVMSRGAKKDGITLLVSSTYRSYDYQKKLFARYVAQDGEALAERYSARVGTSQH